MAKDALNPFTKLPKSLFHKETNVLPSLDELLKDTPPLFGK